MSQANVEHTDRRVQRTRQLLRDALLTLIVERGYDELAVRDITDRANLGRATFYVHYGSKDELLTDSLESLFDELAEQIGKIPAAIEPGVDGFPVQVVFEHAAQNRDLYRLILNGKGSRQPEQRLRAIIFGVVGQRFELLFADRTPPLPVEVMANHVAGSLVALLGWWLESGTAFSADDMAQAFNGLIWHGLLSQLRGNIKS